VLLPGIELRNGSEHEIVIGADPLKSTIPGPDLRNARLVPEDSGFAPIRIRAMPGNDVSMDLASSVGGADLKAIEISDGSPRGLAQTSGDAPAIERLCESPSVACLTGSDNHGWSHAAAAWSVIRIPGWRYQTPAALDLAIRQAIASNPHRVQVVMRRRVPPATSRIGTLTSAFMVGTVMFRELDWPMRLSWILWAWTIAAVASIRLPRRESQRGDRGMPRAPLVFRTFPGLQRPGDAA
jgi:hypothetical protein